MKWTSVEERLPGTRSGKLIVKNDKHEESAYFIAWKKGYYFCIGQDTEQTWEPTHWRSIDGMD